MSAIKYIFQAIAVCFALPTFATPVEFDTPAAHVVVVRPVDIWSGDKAKSEDMKQSVANRHVGYGIVMADGKRYAGSAAMFGSIDDHPITKSVESQLLSRGYLLSTNSKYTFGIAKPVEINPADTRDVLLVQKELFKRAVINQGNPRTLQDRVSARKFAASLVSLATFAFAADKFGATTASQLSLGSGMASDIYQAVSKYQLALAPVDIGIFDFSGYAQVEMRKVGAVDRVGQIIIAYKEAKTPQSEQDALIRAIIILAGSDTTPDEIEQSRASDYAARLAIWDTCVSEGKEQCKTN